LLEIIGVRPIGKQNTANIYIFYRLFAFQDIYYYRLI
jgi:hypothetical protein